MPGIPGLGQIKWKKLASIATLIVTIVSGFFGAYNYLDQKFVSETEMNAVLTIVHTNTNTFVDMFKTVGSSFYDVNIQRLDEAITFLENKNKLSDEERLQLNILKQFRNKLQREKALLESLKVKPLKVE